MGAAWLKQKQTYVSLHLTKKKHTKKKMTQWLLLQIQTFICGKIRIDALFFFFVQCSSSCTTAKLIHKANTNYQAGGAVCPH